LTEVKQKWDILLECNKNYAILALNCMLKNLKEKLSVLGTCVDFKHGPYLKEAKVWRNFWSFDKYGNLSKAHKVFRLSKMILASTYMLHLLLATGLQFQRKVLKGGIRSYKERSKCVTIDTGVWS